MTIHPSGRLEMQGKIGHLVEKSVRANGWRWPSSGDAPKHRKHPAAFTTEEIVAMNTAT
jgi:hypothetical protein